MLFIATTGTDIISGVTIYNSMELTAPIDFHFLAAEIIITAITHLLLIILAVMGSIFAMIDVKFRKISLTLLTTSQILIVFTLIFNIAAIGVFNKSESEAQEAFDLEKLYVLNIIIVIYLVTVFLYEIAFMIAVIRNKRVQNVTSEDGN